MHAAPKVLPVLNAAIDDIQVNANQAPRKIDLNSTFGTEAIDDNVVRFTSQTSNGGLVMDFALFSNRTPLTRANFLNYVTSNRYDQSFIHRSVPGFVIQGGGFFNSAPESGLIVSSIPTDPAVTNEYGVSNTYSTISMAKTGGDPNSATSQWFVSLGDNSENLDNQNGGFTVFGRVTKSTMPSAAAFGNPAQFPIWNAGGAFTNLPLNASFDNSANITDTDLILFP
ncbi:MAG: peptidylprolyl isomerase, partial [Verrucomicrobiae bacterium]|nr:peptidylprolyl isomerase [Verrucomicrobiae bacterium]NNJ87567.1 peptidylprolyl isomerase [Akkermansiaceae bacterium]